MPAPKYRRCYTPKPQHDAVLLMKWTGDRPNDLRVWTNDPMWVEFFQKIVRSPNAKNLGIIRGVRKKKKIIDCYITLKLPVFGGPYALERPVKTEITRWTGVKLKQAQVRMAYANRHRRTLGVPKIVTEPDGERLINEIDAILQEK